MKLLLRRILGIFERLIWKRWYCRRCYRPKRPGVEFHCTKLFPDDAAALEVGGCYPMCEACWQECTPEQRVPFYRKQTDFHISQNAQPDLEEYERIWQAKLRAVLAGR